MTGRVKQYLMAGKYSFGDIITETQPTSGYNKAIIKIQNDN